MKSALNPESAQLYIHVPGILFLKSIFFFFLIFKFNNMQTYNIYRKEPGTVTRIQNGFKFLKFETSYLHL